MVELTAKKKIALIKQAIGAPLSESEHYLALDFETTRIVRGRGHFPGEMADPKDPDKPVSASPLQYGLAHLKINEFGQLVPDPERPTITGTVWPEFREGNVGFLKRKLSEEIVPDESKKKITVGEFTHLTEEQFVGQAVSQHNMALAILNEMQGMTTVNIIGHKLPFDITILTSIAQRYNLTVPQIVLRDTLTIEEAIMGREKGLNTLQKAAQRLGVVVETAHSALVDALTSVAVFNKRYAEYGPTTTPQMEDHAKLTEPKKNPATMHHTSYTGRPDAHVKVAQQSLLEKHESPIPKTFAEQVQAPGLPVQEPVRLDNLSVGSATSPMSEQQQSMRIGQGTMTAKEMHDRIVAGMKSLVAKGVVVAEEAAFDILWQSEAGVTSDPAQATMYGRGPTQGAYAATFQKGKEKISLDLRGLGRTMYDRPGAQYQERAIGIITESGAAAVISPYYNVAGEYDPRRPQEGFQPSYQPEYRSPEEHLALAIIRSFKAGERHRLIGGARADPYTSQRAFADYLIEGSALGDRDVEPKQVLPGGALVISHENLVRNLRMTYEYSTRMGLALLTKSAMQTSVAMEWMNRFMETGIRAVDSPELRGVRWEKPDSENLFGGGSRRVTARGYRFAYNVRGTTGVSGSNIVENDPKQLAKMTYAKGKIGPFGATQDIAYPWLEYEGEMTEALPGDPLEQHTGFTRRQARYEMSNISLQDEMIPEPEWTQQTFMVSGKILSGAGIMSREAFMQRGSVNVVRAQEQYPIPIENLNRLVEEHSAVNAKKETILHKAGPLKGKPKMFPMLILPRKGVFRKLRSGGTDVPIMSWLEEKDTVYQIAPQRMTAAGEVRSGSVRATIGPSRGLLEGFNISLPKYMDLTTGKGVTDPTDIFEVDPDNPDEFLLTEGYGRTEDVIGKQLQERLEREYKGGQVTLSYWNRPATITAYFQREVAVSGKGGIGTFKQGIVPGNALTGQVTLNMQSQYSAEIARIMGSGTVGISNIAGDIKQPARALLSGFGHMPRSQQAALVRRLLPGTDDLATWIENQPGNEAMSIEEVAKWYATTKNISGAAEYSGLEFAQELLGSVMGMTPEQNAQLYRDFGIGRVKGTAHIGIASEGTRMFYQTEARRIEAEKYEKELLSVMQAGRVRSPTKFMGDYFESSGRNAPVDLSYMKMVLPGAIYNTLLGLGEADQRQATRRIANFIDKKVSQRLGFTALKGFGGYFDVTQELEGLSLPTAFSHRPEYISTSFRLGYEGMYALSSQFPVFAEATGYLPGQKVLTNATRSDQGWLSTLSADMFRQETKKGLGFIESENVVTITQNMAERIYAKMSKGDRPEILLDNQRIIEEEYRGVTGLDLPENAILKFERNLPDQEKFVDYLQSPGAMAAMDIPDITGTSQGHFAVMYNNALSLALRATWEGGIDNIENASSALDRIYNKFETAGLGRKTELGRMLTGRRVGAGFFGHFQPMMKLGLQEVAASNDIALIFARQAGFKTVDAFYNWIDETTKDTDYEGKLPGYFMRVPQLSRPGGVLPTFLLTPSEMKRRGIYDPDIMNSPRYQGILWTSPTVATSQIGDFDDDPLGYMLAISVKKDEMGHWARSIIEDPNAMAQLRSKDKAYVARVKSQLKDMFGEGSDKYNVVRNELLESGFDEKDQWEVLKKKAAGGHRYDLHQLTIAIQTKILNDSIKARAYQAMRAEEAAWSAGAATGAKGYTGAEAQAIANTAVTSMTAIYQRGLDLMVTPAEGISPLENMLSSMKVIFDPVYGKNTNATQLSFRPDPKADTAFYPWRSTGDNVHPTGGLRKMATSIAGMQYISDEALAMALSDAGNRESYERIFNAVGGKSIKERQDIVSNMVDLKQITTNATTWRFMLSNAAQRFARSEQTANLVDYATIPYWGENDKAITVSEFLKKQDVLLTNTLFDVFTSDVGNMAKSGLSGMTKALQGIAQGSDIFGVDQALAAYSQITTGAGISEDKLKLLLAKDIPEEFTREQEEQIYRRFYGGRGVARFKVGASDAYWAAMQARVGEYPFSIPGLNPQKWSIPLARSIMVNLLDAIGIKGEGIIESWGPELERGSRLEKDVLKKYNETMNRKFQGTQAYIEEGGKRERRPGGIFPVETDFGTVEFEMHADAIEIATGEIAEVKTINAAQWYEEGKRERGLSPAAAREYAIKKARQAVETNPQYRLQTSIYQYGIAKYRKDWADIQEEVLASEAAGDSERHGMALHAKAKFIQKALEEFAYTNQSETSIMQFLEAKPPRRSFLGGGISGSEDDILHEGELVEPIAAWLKKVTPESQDVISTPESVAINNLLAGVEQTELTTKQVKQTKQPKQKKSRKSKAEREAEATVKAVLDVQKQTQEEFSPLTQLQGLNVSEETEMIIGVTGLPGEDVVNITGKSKTVLPEDLIIASESIAISEMQQAGNLGEVTQNLPIITPGQKEETERGVGLSASQMAQKKSILENAAAAAKRSSERRSEARTRRKQLPTGGSGRGSGSGTPITPTTAGTAEEPTPGESTPSSSGGGIFGSPEEMHETISSAVRTGVVEGLEGAEFGGGGGRGFRGPGAGLKAQVRQVEKAAMEYQKWQTQTRDAGYSRWYEEMERISGELGYTPQELVGKSPAEIDKMIDENARAMGITDPVQIAERKMRAIGSEAMRFTQIRGEAEKQASTLDTVVGQSASAAARKTLSPLREKDEAYSARQQQYEELLATYGSIYETAKSTEGVSESRALKEKSLPLSGAAKEVLSELEKKMGDVTKAAKEYNDVLEKHGATSKDATEAAKKYQLAIASLKPTEAAMTFVDEFQKAIGEEFRTKEGLFTEARKYVAWAKGEGEAPTWVPEKERTGAEFDRHRMKATAVEKMIAATEFDVSQERAMRQEEAGEGGFQARFGKLARTLFGGWGLMYMGSIGRLMTRGAYQGLQEREQMEMQFAGPYMQAVGGTMPYTPQEEQARILATQYGGAGGLAMQRAMNYVMREQQPVYNMANMALGGVSAMGFTAFVAGTEGMPRQQAMRLSAIAGAGTMLATTALNIAGAYEDVPGSALSIATRQRAGQNVYQPNIGAITGGILSGAGMGFMIGHAPGALIGGIAGGVLGAASDYQAVAGYLNPEIRRQAEIIQAFAGAGQQGLTPMQILTQYNLPASQLSYYSRLGAQARLQEFPGYSQESIAYATAQGAKYNAALNDEQIKALAEMAMQGVDAEKIAKSALATVGMTAIQMTAGTAVGATQQDIIQQSIALPGNLRGADLRRAALATPLFPGGANRTGFDNTITALREHIKWTMGFGLSPTEREEFIQRQRSGGEISAPVGLESIYGASANVQQPSYVMAFENIITNTFRNNPAGREAFEAGVNIMGSLPAGLRESMWGKLPEQKTPQELFDWYKEQIPNYQELEATGWLPYYVTEKMQEETSKALGIPFKKTPEPTSPVWRGGPDTLQRQKQRDIEEAYTNQVLSLTQQIEQNLTSLGWTTGGATSIAGATGGQMGLLSNLANRVQFAQNVVPTLQRGGMQFGRAQEIANAFIPMTGPDFAMFSGALGMDPMRLMQVALQSPGFGGGMLTNMFGGQTSIGTIGMTGYTDVTQSTVGGGYTQFTPTGLRWGTTSLANATAGLTSQQMGAQIFGTGAGMSQGAMSALIQGGTRGYQDYIMNRQYQNTMAQIGIGYQQIALQERYQPQFWAIEDQMRNLGYQQQEWRFDFSQRQLDASNYWWNQNRGLERRQMGFQREWAREDWGYQDQTRALQWQWRQEDFQESIRFTTGRERRIGERQMRRDTIMYNLEEEQIDKQRDRQKELWKLEDERFRMSKEQHDQQIAFQQEEIDKSREFYQLRKALELEQVKLQREYWKEQMELQKRSLGIQAGFAKEMHESEKALIAVQRAAEDADGQVRMLGDEAIAGLSEQLANAVPLFDAYIDRARELNNVMEAIVGAQGGGWDDDYEPESGGPRAGGGPVIAGILYPVNEYGKEYFRPNQNGTIIPLDSKNPWNNSVTSTASGTTVQQTTIIVNLGNETLGKYVSKQVMKEIEL